MSTIAYSLKSIKDGVIPDDGTMSTMLVQRGLTYKGTASLKEDAPTTFDVESEENDDPEASFTKRGKRMLVFSTFDYAPALLQAYKGGTVVGTVWQEPDTAVEIERSFQLITKQGVLVEIPRGKVPSLFNAEFKQDGVALLENTITVLKPKGVGVKAINISQYTDPVVSAGNAQSLTASTGSLTGTATPYRGGAPVVAWTCSLKPNGAGAPTIATPAALTTAISGLVSGVYKFTLTAVDDNGFEGTATVTITVTITP